MAEHHFVALDTDDLELAGKIIKNVQSVSTPEAAVKWALKECAAKWKGIASVEVELIKPPKPNKIKVSPAVVSPVSLPTRPRPPLWDHSLGVYKVPLRDLSGLSHSVWVGSDTLEHLVPNRAKRADIQAGAIRGKIKT